MSTDNEKYSFNSQRYNKQNEFSFKASSMFLQLLYFEKVQVFYDLWAQHRILPSDTKAVVSSISSTAASKGPEKKRSLGLKGVIFHPKYP